MLILAIESSCDDTAAAVIDGPELVLSSIISSQFDIHSRFGGIVPELASRAHIEAIRPVVDQALIDAGVHLNDIELIAATRGPGLVGSLLVGFTFAKAVAMVQKIPCVGVDHVAGHLLSSLLESKEGKGKNQKPDFPYTALIVSGGNSSLFIVNNHTDLQLIGRTRDDAAGEAFDKVAKLLELGYPGGPEISRFAKNGDPDAIDFPRAWLNRDSLDFSFSGLKTSVANFVNRCRQHNKDIPVEDICASFQEAVIEVLVEKTIRAAIKNKHKSIALGGGVACNLRLREELKIRCLRSGFSLYIPTPLYCTDNAAMIGLAGYYQFKQGNILFPDDDAYPRTQLN